MLTMTSAIGPAMAGVAIAKSPNIRRLSAKTSTASSDVGFLSSKLSGIKLSIPQFDRNSILPISAPIRPSLQPVARRVCPFTGKKANKANRVSHSNHKTIRRQYVNLQYKRIWWEAGKRFVKLRLSTKAIKTIEKNGIDAVAKEAGIDLARM